MLDVFHLRNYRGKSESSCVEGLDNNVRELVIDYRFVPGIRRLRVFEN